MSAHFEAVLKKLRSLCLAFPETTESFSWGHPNFRAGNKTFATFETTIDRRPSIAFRVDKPQADSLLRRREFFQTPYGRGKWVSMWADGAVDWHLVADLLEESYRVVALRRMIKKLETESRSGAVLP